MPHCIECVNSTFCTNCGINAYFDSLRSQCLCNGFWVTGGCTAIFYCKEVDPVTGICVRCGDNFTLSLTGLKCECLIGNTGMSGVCASITGCLTAALIHGKVQCVSCNSTANFRLTLNSTCDCSGGLTFSNGTCIPVCGDGLLYLDEACDDGNNIDGDGCSSTCSVEKNY
jgi:cysteine-rich repeat protein